MDKRSHKGLLHALCAASFASMVTLAPRVARAQDEGAPEAPPAEPAPAEPPAAATPAPAPAPAAPAAPAAAAAPEPPPPAAPANAATAGANPGEWKDHEGRPPNAIEPMLSGLGDCQNAFTADVAPGTHIDWHACTQLDLGYARYTFPNSVNGYFTGSGSRAPDEDFYIFTGRIAVGPVLQHDFGDRYFVRVVGQLVGWLRESVGAYQINIDDLYAQVGKKQLWDVQVGRLMTWAVFQRPRGFDLYTVEDTGALTKSPYEGSSFGVYKYEVNNIWLREPPGRVAFHVFPAPVFGVEAAAVYGKAGTNNTYGGRGVAVFQNDFLRVAAGGEYRNSRLAVTPQFTDTTGALQDCAGCGVSKWYGFGGSANLAVRPAEAGVLVARGFSNVNSIKDGTHDTGASAKTTTIGGYLQVDACEVAFKRSLVLGAGAYRTEKLNDADEFDRHIQGAAYVYFPLGFNNAGLKFVFSRATDHLELSNGNNTFIAYNSALTAARVRFEYYY